MCVPPSTALTVAATVAAGYQQYAEGQAAKAAAKYNARVLSNDAVRVRNAATEQENDHRRRVAQLISKQRAELGAAGVRVDSGSALTIQQDTEMIGNIDALRIRSGADQQVAVLEDERRLVLAEGDAAASAGRIALGTSILSGGGTLFLKRKRKPLETSSEK